MHERRGLAVALGYTANRANLGRGNFHHIELAGLALVSPYEGHHLLEKTADGVLDFTPKLVIELFGLGLAAVNLAYANAAVVGKERGDDSPENFRQYLHLLIPPQGLPNRDMAGFGQKSE